MSGHLSGLGFNAVHKLYDALVNMSWPGLALYYLTRVLRDGKYRTSYVFRLGLRLPPRLPSVPRVWIHALSVGEVMSSLPLVHRFREKRPDLKIVYSTATESGQSTARKLVGRFCEDVFFLPHDFSWAMVKVVQRLNPLIFVLVESDLWPNLILTLAHRNTKLFLVNGRISPASFNRLFRIRSFLSPVLRGFNYIFTQSEHDRKRYQSLGALPYQLVNAGNLKFELALMCKYCGDPGELRRAFGIQDERPIWIAGSVHQGEERKLLAVHRELLRHLKDLLFIIAPRQPSFGERILRECKEMGLTVARRAENQEVGDSQVFILDSIGELARVYSLADAAFIGGSLVPVGGHNPLEAVVYGVPTCWGPYFHNFEEIGKILEKYRCGQRVEDEFLLTRLVHSWLMAENQRELYRNRAMRVFVEHGNASERIFRLILKGLD